jgi:hypothetical protein
VNIAPWFRLPVDRVSWNVCASSSVLNDYSRCREFTLYRTVHLCGQSGTCQASHVCWQEPAAQRWLLPGLWWVRSHFFSTVV